MLYHEIAWYLLYELAESGHLAIRRLDRWSSSVTVLGEERSRAEQQASLQVANRLLRDGWGLFLGDVEPQRLERLGKGELIEANVRFFGPVARFILEGEQRHPRQRLRLGPNDELGRLQYVDYGVRLPERSLPKFFRWVNRFLEQAQVLAPADWVEQYRKRAAAMARNYGLDSPS